MKTKSTTTLKDPSVANNGGNCYIIIHVCPPNSSKQQPLQTKGPDHVTKCSVDAVDSPKLLHLTDTRSTQVYPYDLDPGNYSHPKNRSTQTEQIRRSNNGVQTVPCSRSSEASQTASSYFDIPRSGPFTTTGTNNICGSTTTSVNSCSSTATKAYLNRLMKAKPDGPIIHGPFYCDCPGGLDFCKQDFF